jgi:hypothetical protein
MAASHLEATCLDPIVEVANIIDLPGSTAGIFILLAVALGIVIRRPFHGIDACGIVDAVFGVVELILDHDYGEM